MGAPVKPPGRGPGFTGQANKSEEGNASPFDQRGYGFAACGG